MDEKTFYATVAERAGLSKEEVVDLTRATLEELAGQISGGEVAKLAAALPEWLVPHLPRHDGRSHPKQVTEFIRELGRRTGLNEDETHREESEMQEFTPGHPRLLNGRGGADKLRVAPHAPRL